MTAFQLALPRNIQARFLGYDNLLNEVHRIVNESGSSEPGYPPLNLFKDEDGYTIELAVAGYKKGDISIEHDRKNHVLNIKGESTRGQEQEDEESQREVIRRGIATRSFTRGFTLSDDLEVETASLEDGMLAVKLKRVVREEDKPLQISIK